MFINMRQLFTEPFVIIRLFPASLYFKEYSGNFVIVNVYQMLFQAPF